MRLLQNQGKSDVAVYTVLSLLALRGLDLSSYEDQVVEDAADRLWALYSSIAHSILEGYAGVGYDVETEATATVDGMRVSGHLDRLMMPNGTIQDYKFTSAWTVREAKKQGKPEWERQLNRSPIALARIDPDLQTSKPQPEQGLFHLGTLDQPLWVLSCCP